MIRVKDTIQTVKDLTEGRGVNALIVAVGRAIPIKNGLDILDYEGILNSSLGHTQKQRYSLVPPSPTL